MHKNYTYYNFNFKMRKNISIIVKIWCKIFCFESKIKIFFKIKVKNHEGQNPNSSLKISLKLFFNELFFK